jgi:hypothetical protein
MRQLVIVPILWLAACAPALAADKFTSETGKFAAAFPKDKQPLESVKEVDTTAGKIKLTIHAAEVKKDVAFMVIWNDYPDATAKMDPQEVLGRVRDGSKGPDGKLLEDKAITLDPNNVPGRDYLLDKGDSHYFRSRTYLAGTRLYQVIISSTKRDDVTSKDAEGFLDSFEITK